MTTPEYVNRLNYKNLRFIERHKELSARIKNCEQDKCQCKEDVCQRCRSLSIYQMQLLMLEDLTL